MAEDKLSWSELRHTLARRANVSEKVANTFLNALNAQLIEALKQDKQVKINGLGTFRLQAVAPRKSVNVTTGEAIIIEGYNKITFAPEVSVKELIENKGDRLRSEGDEYEMGNIDPLKKLNEQANEIIDILADLGQAPNKSDMVKVKVDEPKVEKPKIEEKPTETLKVEPVKPVEPEVPVQPVQPVQPILPIQPAQPTQSAQPVQPIQPAQPVVSTNTATQVVQQVPQYEAPKPTVPKVEIPKVEHKVEPEPEEPKKESHFWRGFLIFLLILLLIGGAGYYFYMRGDLNNWIELLMSKKSVKAETMWPDDEERDIANDSIDLSPESPENVSEMPRSQTTSTKYKLIKVEPMHRDSRLTWMSMRYYGSKAYWPYIYDANRDRISNPNDIEVGTPIRVPKLTRQQMDTTIEASRLRLQELRRQALEASKR